MVAYYYDGWLWFLLLVVCLIRFTRLLWVLIFGVCWFLALLSGLVGLLCILCLWFVFGCRVLLASVVGFAVFAGCGLMMLVAVCVFKLKCVLDCFVYLVGLLVVCWGCWFWLLFVFVVLCWLLVFYCLLFRYLCLYCLLLLVYADLFCVFELFVFVQLFTWFLVLTL